jgi:hypothetical protein
MKCPKCGYISFDYSQVCAKCSKDISVEQEKMNIPAFRPDPPALLAALTGEANESQVGIPMDGSGAFATDEHQAGIALDESGAISAGGVAFAESQEVEMDFEAEGTGELAATGETEIGADELSDDFSFDDAASEPDAFDTGEISFEDTGSLSAGVEEEDLGLDFDALDEAAPAADEAADKESADDSLELDLDALPDESPAALDEELEAAVDEAALDLDLEGLPEEAPAEEAEEIGGDLDLDLDALPDEAPNGLEEVAEEAEEEIAMDLDLDALPDEAPSGLEGVVEEADEGMALDLDIDALPEAAPDTAEEAADLDDSALDLDLDGIALDETVEPEAAAEGEPELDAAALTEEGFAPAGEEGQIELNIDDLKVNETGELEIGAQTVSAGEEETSFNMDELSMDQALPGEEGEEGTINLDEIGLGDEPPPLESSRAEAEGEEIIDLDDLDIELDLGDSDDKSS